MNKSVLVSGLLVLASVATGCAVQTGPEESTGTPTTSEEQSFGVQGVGKPIPFMGGPVSNHQTAAPNITQHRVGHVHIVPLTPDPPPPVDDQPRESADQAGIEGDDPVNDTHQRTHFHPGTSMPDNGTAHIHIVPLSPDPPPEAR